MAKDTLEKRVTIGGEHTGDQPLAKRLGTGLIHKQPQTGGVMPDRDEFDMIRSRPQSGRPKFWNFSLKAAGAFADIMQRDQTD
ncbi:hypothetical protein SAMN05444581_11583 [Methylocapsa palsarum]|uniref:Uncharacterized protein n=1 Tax=Methylocapsa palsarum TaxID=1612308 RepID=A0A1I4BNP6_9HYPH|nr:hypothetical protein SAMN05444581_11583 [Methylocapsa palsarum]